MHEIFTEYNELCKTIKWNIHLFIPFKNMISIGPRCAGAK